MLVHPLVTLLLSASCVHGLLFVPQQLAVRRSTQQHVYRTQSAVSLEQAAADVESRMTLKRSILTRASEINRGDGASADDQAEIERLASALEALNPTADVLASPLINGRWQLAYTTSASILGVGKKLKPIGPIYQSLDVPTLTARNDDTVQWRFIKLKRFVKADLEPDDAIASKVIVRFRQFAISWLRIPAPKSAIGELDTTFLDEELRISRGDKGNLFVLFKDEAGL